MKLTILARRPAVARLLISLCIVLGLLIANLAAAQEESYIHLTMPLGDETDTYAELGTIVPSAFDVEPYEQKILNYTGGKDIKTSILLNGSRIDIFLLYPCQPPASLLDAEGLISLLATVDANILLANYSQSELYIDDRPAIWGILGGTLFAAYQPTNQTAALIVMDANIDEDTIFDFLLNMNIIVDESMTPIPPGYCADATAAAADQAAAIAAEAANATDAAMDGANAADLSAGIDTDKAAEQSAAPALASATPALSRQDKAKADREAAMAKLREVKAATRK